MILLSTFALAACNAEPQEDRRADVDANTARAQGDADIVIDVLPGSHSSLDVIDQVQDSLDTVQEGRWEWTTMSFLDDQCNLQATSTLGEFDLTADNDEIILTNDGESPVQFDREGAVFHGAQTKVDSMHGHTVNLMVAQQTSGVIDGPNSLHALLEVTIACQGPACADFGYPAMCDTRVVMQGQRQ